jgi:16S rRNA (guanine527-N7)-methyltransferase
LNKRGQGALDLAPDRDRALKLIDVSRETLARLEAFVALLLTWQARINLVAASTLPQLWTRHIADSLQLLPLAPPNAKIWVDFGSGGGFPAIPIACALADTLGAHVHLIESNGKKVAFLREAVRQLKLPATVHRERVENFGDSWTAAAEVVTARALAPLKTLCDQVFPLMAQGTVALFPKGQDVEAELTEAAKYWTLSARKVPSKTNPDGCILCISNLHPRRSAAARP